MAELGVTSTEFHEYRRIATQLADCLEREKPVPAGLIRDVLRRSERMGAVAERTGLQNLAESCIQILDLLRRAFDLAELDAGRKYLHVRPGKVIPPDTKPWRGSRRQTQPITLRNEDVVELVAALRGLPDRIETAGAEQAPQGRAANGEGAAAYMSAADIAEKFSVPQNALRKRLERLRKNHLLVGELWVEDTERTSRGRRYLYNPSSSEVRAIIRDLARP